MILGLLTGEWLKSSRSKLQKLQGMAIGGVGLLLLGLALQWTGVCPIVKRVWTSSYTLYSGGWVLLILAGLYALIDWKGWRNWAFPLIVVGMNSIAIYIMAWTMKGFTGNALNRHFGNVFTVAGPTFEPVLLGFAVMVVFWCILFWMYRKKIFLRI
jgi:predicted acyltransferase